MCLRCQCSETFADIHTGIDVDIDRLSDAHWCLSIINLFIICFVLIYEITLDFMEYINHIFMIPGATEEYDMIEYLNYLIGQ